MTLTLTPEVEALVQEQLDTGFFKNPSDLIETALHVLADCTPRDRIALDALIQEGINDDDRGDVYTEKEARSYLASERAKL